MSAINFIQPNEELEYLKVFFPQIWYLHKVILFVVSATFNIQLDNEQIALFLQVLYGTFLWHKSKWDTYRDGC